MGVTRIHSCKKVTMLSLRSHGRVVTVARECLASATKQRESPTDRICDLSVLATCSVGNVGSTDADIRQMPVVQSEQIPFSSMRAPPALHSPCCLAQHVPKKRRRRSAQSGEACRMQSHTAALTSMWINRDMGRFARTRRYLRAYLIRRGMTSPVFFEGTARKVLHLSLSRSSHAKQGS